MNYAYCQCEVLQEGPGIRQGYHQLGIRLSATKRNIKEHSGILSKKFSRLKKFIDTEPN